jgi:hypothetical protein
MQFLDRREEQMAMEGGRLEEWMRLNVCTLRFSQGRLSERWNVWRLAVGERRIAMGDWRLAVGRK